MAQLTLTKQTGDYWSFVVDGDFANEILNTRNDLLVYGEQCHFKTANGANIVKIQNILPTDVTIVASQLFHPTDKHNLFDILIAEGYFDWIRGDGSGNGATIDRFDELVDTFKYVGKNGMVVVVDEPQMRLRAIPFYNVSRSTQLTDMPTNIVADKMLITDSLGTRYIYAPIPEAPEVFLNAVGYFIYEDALTQETPVPFSANVPVLIPNDALGDGTDLSQAPFGIATIWNRDDSQFDFSDLDIGDTVDFRLRLDVDSSGNNQKYQILLKTAIGSPSEETVTVFSEITKTTGTSTNTFFMSLPINSNDIIEFPSELYLLSDGGGTFKVFKFYFRVLRKNINLVQVGAEGLELKEDKVNKTDDLQAAENNTTMYPSNRGMTFWIRYYMFNWDNLGIKTNLIPSDMFLVADNTNGNETKLIQWQTILNAVPHGIEGSGTGGYLPKFNSSTILADSQFFDTGVNIGLGTIQPNEKLHIIGNVKANSFIKIGGSSSQFLKADGSSDSTVYVDTTTNQVIQGGKIFLDGMLGLANVANTNFSVFRNTNGTPRIYTLQDKDGTVALLSDIPAVPSDIVTGSAGTTNTISKWISSTSIGNSLLTDNGTVLSYNSSAVNASASTIFSVSASGTVRTSVNARGQQAWVISSGTTEVGVFQIAQPSGNVGILMTGNGTGRADIRMNGQFGGIAFATGQTTAFPNTQMLLTTNGELLINLGGSNGVDKLQVGGTILADGFKKTDGLATQFLMADGSVSGAKVDTKTCYIHSTTGNNSTAIIGDPTKPFATTAGAFAALPADNGETYRIFYLDTAVHNITVLIPFRSLIFESYYYGGTSAPSAPMFSTAWATMDFTPLGAVNFIDDSVSGYSKKKINLTFRCLEMRSTNTGNVKFSSANANIIFDRPYLNFINSGFGQNSTFSANSISGDVDVLRIAGAQSVFNRQGLQNDKINIRWITLALAGNNAYLASWDGNNGEVTIGEISGDTSGSIFYLTGGQGLMRINIGNLSNTGKVHLSSNTTNNNIFNFMNTIIGANAILSTGESHGVVTGILNPTNTKGIAAEFERSGSVLVFLNFSGRIETMNKYYADTKFIFQNCILDVTNYLFNMQVATNANTIVFRGTNIFKMNTAQNLISNPSSYAIVLEKQGANAITSNATGLGTNITATNTTPNVY